ncbi:3-hydroxyacyl-CoA dehydrogenase NAD-binding domain-containing protein [Brevibacterium spongiae]|uniref:3-hydroxyacyl-CoA dehydrogenase NAD-binding domain-containing protein n=1 Tax=Brevibacterium spongiae TaxID=2909672 RepID=A0ABY5SU97_9MICO|nr:3-hydroxyacyl-CoA dehydrogenase NAD-binding domain-containing protein [Brevibacterium spongiae]UVI37715.1 3-hydroxyacyl-CoA dehydrogenase NAD-binding domain-containing protein [Brevibacterium spongiae]
MNDSTTYPEFASIGTVTCVGAGTIGGGWAAYFLAQGFRVKIWDPAPDAAEKFARLLDAAWPALAELDMVPGADRNAWSVHTDLAEAVAGTGFVQESAPEDLSLKRGLLSQIDAVCAPHVVIGSSTSGYSMTDMATEAAHPERLVVGHPFNPPYLIPLVEVVGGEQSSMAAVDWAADFYTHIGKSVIRMDREVPGFIANRLQEAQWREALYMVEQGEATVEQIDRSITDGPGLRWPFQGPMLTFHLAGGEGGMAHMLDHFGPSLKSPWTRLTAPELSQSLRDDVVAGCEVEAGPRTIADLVAARDTGIIALRRLTAQLAAVGTEPAGTEPTAETGTTTPAEATESKVPSAALSPDTEASPDLDVYTSEVAPEWIDYNGHMSEAFYVLVFGFATDQVMDRLGLDADYRTTAKASLYTVESHIRYLDEVSLGETLTVVPHLVSAGEKKLHLAYEMFVGDRIVATEEIMALHVDQTDDRVIAFPAEVADRIAGITADRPDWVGRSIG